jgi:hypothetical protein
MHSITNADLTRWALELSAAFVCCIIVYCYIESKIDYHRQEKKKALKEAEEAKSQSNGQSLYENPYGVNKKPDVTVAGAISITQRMQEYINNGYELGLDADIVKEHPEIFDRIDGKKIFVCEDIMSEADLESKVIGLESYKNKTSDRRSGRFQVTAVNELFMRQSGVNPNDITDRVISSYLYHEKSHLLKVIFISKNRESVNRAHVLGLNAALL